MQYDEEEEDQELLEELAPLAEQIPCASCGRGHARGDSIATYRPGGVIEDLCPTCVPLPLHPNAPRKALRAGKRRARRSDSPIEHALFTGPGHFSVRVADLPREEILRRYVPTKIVLLLDDPKNPGYVKVSSLIYLPWGGYFRIDFEPVGTLN